MPPHDLGTALWALVYHLYHAAHSREAAQRAFGELTLRTGMPCLPADRVLATSPQQLSMTTWYKEVSARYAALCDELRQTHASDIAETRSLIKDMYPSGCSVSELAETVQTCVAMLSFTIPHDRTLRFITQLSEQLAAGGEAVYQLRAEDLANRIVDDLVLEAMLPPRWWCRHPRQLGASATVTRIALRVRPVEVWIEYRSTHETAAAAANTTRHRRVKLDHVLQATGPTAPLARRLAGSHDPLVNEEQWQRLLIRLQQLMRRGTTAAATEGTAEKRIATPTTTVPELYVSQQQQQQQQEEEPAAMPATAGRGSKRDAVPQKADVGLLYRDPEAAMVNVDLNDADEVTLREFKAAMETRFAQHALRPGDPGYIYDKRVEVAQPKQRSEWDDDSEDDV